MAVPYVKPSQAFPRSLWWSVASGIRRGGCQSDSEGSRCLSGEVADKRADSPWRTRKMERMPMTTLDRAAVVLSRSNRPTIRPDDPVDIGLSDKNPTVRDV